MPAANQPPRINQQVVTLTLEEWEHINEEIVNTNNLRPSKEVPDSNRSDYKFIVLTYKDDASSE
ncbi:conserved hypothetical protein [Bacillus sp. 349Y]|nr:conserved hypothetical protein [Bacillus sp. 349Y]